MERTRIGILMTGVSNWIAGKYYIQNLLCAINTLEDKQKPIIDLYVEDLKAFEDVKEESRYPYLFFNKYKERYFMRIFRRLVYVLNPNAANNLSLFKVNKDDLFIYPAELGTSHRKVCWKQDFQEKYLPELFSEDFVKKRDTNLRSVCERNIPIVFSSYDSQADFQKYYPQYHNPTFVVQFAVSQQNFSDVHFETVKEKYGISKEYLLCANQFWKHKNHLFLFRTFKKALKEGLDLQLICTGALNDFRNPDYANQINSFLKENGMEDSVKLLGLIDKKELLCLMNNSYAVIQPSLFEGWNTTVEDCKALNKFIFLSDLKVHREQISDNVCFFNPRNEDDLVFKLMTVKPHTNYYDYHKNIEDFGKSFYKVIDYMKNK